MPLLFEVPMSYQSPHACQRLLDCLEAQHFLYSIVRGIREKEYRELSVRVVYPAVFTISVAGAGGGEGIRSWLSVSDLRPEFVEKEKTYPLAIEVARQHVKSFLWHYLSWKEGFPWDFKREVKRGGLFFSRKETQRGDFHGAREKWEEFLGEEVR